MPKFVRWRSCTAGRRRRKRLGLWVIHQFELSNPAAKAPCRGLDFLRLRGALKEMQNLIALVDSGPGFLCARERNRIPPITDDRPVDEAQFWIEYKIEHHLRSNTQSSDQVPDVQAAAADAAGSAGTTGTGLSIEGAPSSLRPQRVSRSLVTSRFLFPLRDPAVAGLAWRLILAAAQRGWPWLLTWNVELEAVSLVVRARHIQGEAP